MTCNMMRGIVAGIALVGLLLAFAAPPAALAAIRYWEPADGIGNWNYGPYWNPAGVPVAGDTARIEAGGDGWTLTCNYINAANPLLADVYVGNINSSGTASASLIQSQDALHAGYAYVGYYGTGRHYQSGGSVTIDNTLYLGRRSGSYGYYELSGGTLSASYSQIGYAGEGDFVQTGGTFTCGQMDIANANYGGPYGVGSYDMQLGTLNASLIYIGGKEEGTFTQSGGTVNATAGGVTLGLDQYGGGHYTLSNGDLNTSRTRLSQSGSTFTQTGGTHDITGDLEVGYGLGAASEALYTLSGSGTLTVSDDIVIGDDGWGRYRQTAGTAVATDAIVLSVPDDAPAGKLQLEGGSLTSARVDNAGNYVQSGGTLTTGIWTNAYMFDQTGGVLNAQQLDNNSTESLHIGGLADCRVNVLYGNTQRIWQEGGILRGKYAGGGLYNMCAFTNGAIYEMDAGEFVGHLTNYGTFTYDGGTFDQSTLTNHGTVNFNADFTCRRIVNNASLTLLWDRRVYADGLGYSNAIENNGSLTMYPRSEINLGSGIKLVNNGPMYAGGPIPDVAYFLGNLENQNYLLPSASGLPSGRLYVNGNFTAVPGAQLRIRIHGTALQDYDQMQVQYNANLGGTLDVRLTSGFVPSLGNSFTLVGYGSHSGTFNPVYLPTLPAGLDWQLTYGSTAVVLTVIEESSAYYGDMNCDNVVDIDDVPLFVQALVDPGNFTGCDIYRGDTNEDLLVNGADTQGFIELLTAGK